MVESLDYLSDAQRSSRRGAVVASTGTPKDYSEVFRRYGLNLGSGDPIAMAEHVQRSPIRKQLLAGLHEAFGRHSFSAFEVPPALAPLLRMVDNHPIRNRIRDAIGERDTARLLPLVRALDADQLLPGFAALVGQQYDLPDADRLRILAIASERFPSDFRLHELLCFAYLNSSRVVEGEPLPESLAFARTEARVLIALRPSSPSARIQCPVR